MPAVVPEAEEFPPGASQKSPHPAKLPNTAITASALSIERQPRRRAGIPRKTRRASTAPPVPIHPLPLRRGPGCTIWLLVAAVEAIVAVTVPLVVLELNATVEGERVQLGASVTVDGLEDVSEQLRVAVPA